MTVFTSEERLLWGALDVPMLGLTKDWHGEAVEPAAGWCLVADPERLWFVAHHARPAELHPAARPGVFQADLWKADCAELFISHPASGRYMEFNLSPNGAWWCGEFKAPREMAEGGDVPMLDVATFADMDGDGAWLAALALPLDLLQARVGFGEESGVNVTMVLNSPEQRFLTAADLGGGEPDFHRPARFPGVVYSPLAKVRGIV
ncbi:MAG: hypothetical protein ACQCXQ_11335 [Verrucomicrobiales bacterium]|nr:hypothetical protein [Verrucomicrobiota bacterium JB025]